MGLIRPETWSRDPWRYRAMLGEDVSSKMDGWVLHWPGTPKVRHVAYADLADTVRLLRSYERYHVDTLGWRGIAYDYAVDMAGRKFLCRGTGRSGATSGDYDEDGISNNRETDALLFVVGSDDVPTDAQVRAGIELVDQLGGPRRYLIPHRSGKGTSTTCPGPHVVARFGAPAQRWAAFRDRMFPDVEEPDVSITPEQVRAIVADELANFWADRSDDAAAKAAAQVKRIVMDDPETGRPASLHRILTRTRVDGRRAVKLALATAEKVDAVPAATIAELRKALADEKDA